MALKRNKFVKKSVRLRDQNKGDFTPTIHGQTILQFFEKQI
jgi:hypothetical protein